MSVYDDPLTAEEYREQREVIDQAIVQQHLRDSARGYTDEEMLAPSIMSRYLHAKRKRVHSTTEQVLGHVDMPLLWEGSD